jgi:BirA family biotin operon repressor/biotin-[acetyl-CoA-carboxylase] ligase
MSPTTLATPTETSQESLSIEVIRRLLDNEVVGLHMYLFGEVASTNAVLRRVAEAGAREGTVVLAEEQRHGRGRLGQAWFSPPGVNLYASVLFRPDLAPEAVPAFSLIASLALTDAVWVEGLPAAIREPNDVLVDGRKVAGTLVECATTAGRTDYVILGVGVNVNVTRDALREALGTAAEGATSLRAECGRAIDRNAFAASFLGFLEKWFEAYTARGPATVMAAWRSRRVTTVLSA